MDTGIPLEVLIQIQIEYLDMPGLKLTPAQIRKLCGLPQELCEGALALLIRTGFLRQSADGAIEGPRTGAPCRTTVIA